jgi:hypothetical protein
MSTLSDLKSVVDRSLYTPNFDLDYPLVVAGIYSASNVLHTFCSPCLPSKTHVNIPVAYSTILFVRSSVAESDILAFSMSSIFPPSLLPAFSIRRRARIPSHRLAFCVASLCFWTKTSLHVPQRADPNLPVSCLLSPDRSSR